MVAEVVERKIEALPRRGGGGSDPAKISANLS